MKKLLILLSMCLIIITSNASTLKGKVRIEGGDSFGVFVYIEDKNLYDISDENGEYIIEGLEKGKEYTVTFQKENYPEYKKILKLVDNITEDNTIIKQYGDAKPKFKVRGSVRTNLKDRIFLNIPKLGYGIIVKPQEAFYFELEKGNYTAQVIQTGSYEKQLSFKVEEREINDIGNIKLIEKEKNNLRIFLEKIKDPLYLYLYMGEDIIKVKKIDSKNPSVLWENLNSGEYKIVIKGYGYKEINKSILLKGRMTEKIVLEELRKQDNLYINIYPEGIAVNLKVYTEETLIKEIEDIKDFYILEKMDTNKEYTLKFTSEKYKEMEVRNIKAGEKIDISLLRDIKGTLLHGSIYPFNSGAEIMLLQKGKILGKTRIKENGSFELDLDEIKSGKHVLRIYADGFKEVKIIRTINQGKLIENINIGLESLVTSLFGKVETSGFDDKNCLVIIDELNYWQFTNEKGEYYFNNIPDGKYTLIVKKLGYDEIKKEILISKQESKKINFELKAKAKLIIKSNLKNYDLIINGKKELVKNFVYEKEIELGKIELLAKRKGSLDIENELFFSEPGQEKEFKIEFQSFETYKMGLQNRVFEIEDDISGLKVKDAERKLENFKKMKHWDLYKDEVKKIEMILLDAKLSLFEADRDIRKQIKEMQLEIDTIENSKITFRKKRSELQKKYKESLEEIEYILKERSYTSLKVELYTLQGDIYTKMGMVNSARKSYSDAERNTDQ